MSTGNKKKLNRHYVSALPLLDSTAEKMGLRGILNDFFPQKANEEINPVDTLMLLIFNLAIGKHPLYELEGWVNSLDLRCINYEKYQNIRFTDDRFGNALDALYACDRASLMTKIVVEMVRKFNVDLKQIHNDSTSVCAYGKYLGKTSTGFELKKGNSKDHKPGLKQLIYCLSLSADGAVPVHCKTYPGNRNDDTTHIETWDTLLKISKTPNFLYVADCKLCSDSQLSHIVENGGRAITCIPDYWKEVGKFKASQRENPTAKKEIWRRHNEETNETVYFSAYMGEYKTDKRGYAIHWIHSSAKQREDYSVREKLLKKAEIALCKLLEGLNRRHLKTEDNIRNACDKILKKHNLEKFIDVVIDQTKEAHVAKSGKGRPTKNVKHKTIEKTVFCLSWTRNKKALDAEKKVDGIYPLLATDPSLSSKEVLVAYKYQPKLEKRFMQLKSIHNIGPLLLKKLERVEANMFLFFVALLIQALIEKEIRDKMKKHSLNALQVYPERRDATHPTTSKVFDIFSDVSTYVVSDKVDIYKEYTDELDEVQKTILRFLDISEERYWHGIG